MTEYRPKRTPGDTPKPRPRKRAPRASDAQPREATGRQPRTQARTRGDGASQAPRQRTQRPGQRPNRPARPRPGQRPKGRGGLRAAGLVLLTLLVALLITGGVVYASISASLPDPNAALGKGRDQTTTILDRDGRVLTRLYAEQNRSDRTLDRIPTALKQAVIATEDQRFYEHAGVDPTGIARAVVNDVVLRRKAQGGSTITQQYVKQAFVGTESTLRRKVAEAMLANRIEKRYSKDEILELYLNTIYFGHGAYGVESAAQAYFGKSVEKLSVPEAAMIAGVIKSPGRYSPYLEPAAAKNRRDTVLGQMRAQNYLKAEAYAKAVATPVKTSGLKSAATAAPYFVEWIKQLLGEKYGQEQIYRGGLVVRTTLDLAAQRAAEKAISGALDHKGDPSAALVAVEPGTGAVIAMVGGRDFKTQQYNVAVQGQGRQPGSAFKPFVLATALDQGVSPEKTFESGPVKLAVGSQTWSVTGAGGGARGPMRLRKATEKSVNSVYAKLILDVSPEKVVATAEKLGLRKGMNPVPTIALGGLETGVTPLEMADAYATLAAGGRHAVPYGIAEVKDAKGKVLFTAKAQTDDAIEPAVAYLTTDILRGVIAHGTGKSAAIGRPAAGKTGTTQEYRDAWFVGYTPQISAAVWVGFPGEQKAMTSIHGGPVTGGSIPAKIWAEFMRGALKGQAEKEFAKPAGLKRATVCLETGLAATQFCPSKGSELFLDETRLASCTKHAAPAIVKVPSLVGMTKQAALALLGRVKLAVTVTEADVAGVSAGTVAAQTPAAGSVATTQTVVTLTVSNGGVANSAPTAGYQLPAKVKAGRAVPLDGSASRDDGTIVTWYWEFGDSATGSGAKVTHAWAAIGDYDVTLWVTDDHGQQASITKRLHVQ